VLVCGTGIGMSIAANKIPGVRAALVRDVRDAEMSRLHNDSNVLVLGADGADPAQVREIVRTWCSTAFEGGRHTRRIDKISNLERPGKTRNEAE
jgi:RpiB/LacA/LacB family sugar-phosphate isomerase